MAELSWITPFLAIGPRPTSRSAWPTWAVLRKESISLVIDLNDSPNEKDQAVSLGIKYQGLKIPDPTEVDDFLSAFPVICKMIDNERKASGKVYLHCTAGMSRSPTCAMAYLISTGQAREEARKLVQNAHEPAWTGGDVETLERAIHLWQKQNR